MQLWQLGLLVVAGISLVVYLVHVSGGSSTAILSDELAAIARFQNDFPEYIPLQVYITTAGQAAFLALPDQSIGLVHAFGDSFLTRAMTKDDRPKVTTKGTELSLQLSDFTYKGGTFSFANKTELQSVYNLFRALGAANA